MEANVNVADIFTQQIVHNLSFYDNFVYLNDL